MLLGAAAIAAASAGAEPPSGLAPMALQPLPLGAIAPQVRNLATLLHAWAVRAVQ